MCKSKIFDRVFQAAALRIFNSVNECYPKVCLNKGKKSLRTTFTLKVNSFCYFVIVVICYLQTIVVKIYLCIFIYQKNVFYVVSVPYMKNTLHYVTK